MIKVVYGASDGVSFIEVPSGFKALLLLPLINGCCTRISLFSNFKFELYFFFVFIYLVYLFYLSWITYYIYILEFVPHAHYIINNNAFLKKINIYNKILKPKVIFILKNKILFFSKKKLVFHGCMVLHFILFYFRNKKNVFLLYILKKTNCKNF